MTLSITCKASEADLILSGSSIFSSTSSSLDTSITLTAGFSCFLMISLRISRRQEMLPASIAGIKEAIPCQNPRNYLGQRYQQVPSASSFIKLANSSSSSWSSVYSSPLLALLRKPHLRRQLVMV